MQWLENVSFEKIEMGTCRIMRKIIYLRYCRYFTSQICTFPSPNFIFDVPIAMMVIFIVKLVAQFSSHFIHANSKIYKLDYHDCLKKKRYIYAITYTPQRRTSIAKLKQILMATINLGIHSINGILNAY